MRITLPSASQANRDDTMNLSKNLTLAEATKSQTATRKGIDNTPTDAHLDALRAVAQNIFQPLRDYFGLPIAVTSGYRSKALNTAIGGSNKSQHSRGEALDIDAHVFGGVTNREVFLYILKNLEFDQLIFEFGDELEPAWVHVSYKANGENRGEVLRAYRQGGRTRYKLWTR